MSFLLFEVESHAVRSKQRSTHDEHSVKSNYNNYVMLIKIIYNIILEYKHTNTKEVHVYTEVQVQGQNLNTNKQIEVISNNELHCMSSNLFHFVLKHLQEEDTQTTD